MEQIQFDPTGHAPHRGYTQEALKKLLTGMGFQVQQLERWKLSDTQNGLFALSQKTAHGPVAHGLADLYRCDPGQLMARLEQICLDVQTVTIRAHNMGWSAWTPQTVYLSVRQYSSSGLVNEWLCLPFMQEVAPGNTIDFQVLAHQGDTSIDTCRWIFELCQINPNDKTATLMSLSGLANPVFILTDTVVPCVAD